MKIKRTATFKRNFKALKKKNFDMVKFEKVLNHLINRDQEILTREYRDHGLKGKLNVFRELHITSDWLLVYQVTKENELVLLLVTMGSHDDVFRNSQNYI